MALACSLKGISETPSMLIWLAKSLWEVLGCTGVLFDPTTFSGFLLLGAGSSTQSISLCRFATVG